MSDPTTNPTPEFNPSLAIDIGQAERILRALLDRLLADAGITFPEWTVLVTLDRAGPRPIADLVHRQLEGRAVADAAAARASVDHLRAEGLVAPTAESGDAAGDGPVLAPTPAGEAVYGPLRQTVDGLTEHIYGGLAREDIETTRRTLAEVTDRARARLAAAS